MTSTIAPGSVYEVHNMCRYFQQTFYFNSNFRFLQWWLSQMLTPGTCYHVARHRWLVSKDLASSIRMGQLSWQSEIPTPGVAS